MAPLLGLIQLIIMAVGVYTIYKVGKKWLLSFIDKKIDEKLNNRKE